MKLHKKVSIISILSGDRKVRNNILSEKWAGGAIPAAKRTGLCNLVKVININTKHLTADEIDTYIYIYIYI